MEIDGPIGEVIEITRGKAVKNGISVRTNFGKGLPVAEADRTQLQQVILNLMINGIQALGQSSQDQRGLLISTSASEPHAVPVSVQDTRPGICPESLGRLFNPFYTTKPGGMGMGLSVCRSIIEAHGGRIWATANFPRGAAFYFTVPTARQ